MISTEALYDIFKKHPGVTTDTRSIKKGDLFFALKGPNFNANTFAEQALSIGAAYAVVDDPACVVNERCLLTADVLEALQSLALHHRRQLNIPVIGITGSNGKTTTKELMHAVLSQKFNTLATKGNLNNHIGVPMTLLLANASHEIAIIEMGANHIGEIRDLCLLCHPDYGLITSIGKAHLEGFGSFEGVIKAKSELYEYIRKNKGRLFVSSDNDLLMGLASDTSRTGYGTKPGSLVKGKISGMTPFLSVSWQQEGEPLHTIQTQLIGAYNFDNILAAICVGVYFGVDSASINSAIAGYTPENNRSQLIHTSKNELILDAYNANPTSLTAAIENFSGLEGNSKVVIVGDMLELGSGSADEHSAILRLLETKKFAQVILIGPEFKKALGTIKAKHFLNASEAQAWLTKNPVSQSLVLIKGSRGMKLETLVESL
jgi:UDP-N-acetylmuramoyl-tripeptide--D-alanyl-D-alanine ligase